MPSIVKLALLLALLVPVPPVVQAAKAAAVAATAERNELPALRSLLAQRPDVNARQSDGMTALHWAVSHNDLEAATLLVRAGADVRATNRYAVAPLSIACQNGDHRMVQLLLDAGADPNTTLPGGETALMTAARTGRPGPVKALIAQGADVNARERNAQTAIMWAAAEGHTEVVQSLLEAGADWKVPLESGFTPLFFAVREGRSEVVQLLLAAGADINEPIQPRKRTGRGPLPGSSPLILAIENGHFELATSLLAAGADPNDLRSGFAPLHIMSWVRKPNRGDGDDDLPPPAGSGRVGSLEFVRTLVAHGADVSLRLKSGRSGRGHLSRTGATPFLLAADTADLPFMRLLVELGADPLLANAEGATPLMAAAGLGTQAPGEEAGTDEEALTATQYILELGGDINAVDQSGETAMHGAAYKNLPEIVHLLAQRGARIEVWNRPNKHGWTPLAIAEGYRPGNFRPSAETIAALHSVMIARGITPPRFSAAPQTGDADWEAPPTRPPTP